MLIDLDKMFVDIAIDSEPDKIFWAFKRFNGMMIYKHRMAAWVDVIPGAISNIIRSMK